MCGSKPPKAPDMRPQAEASMYAADKAFEISKEQLAWAKEQWNATQEMLGPLLDQQFEMSEEQRELARVDRQRWRETFLPAEDRFVQKALDYDTRERRELEAGRAQAAVQQALDAQRANAQQRLNSYGIDPSQTRSQAIDAAQRTAGAAAMAAAGNQARARTEQVGTALLSDVSNMGRGLPGQAAASYAGAVNAGNSMAGNQNQATGTFMPALGSASGWHSQGMQGINQSANITNMGYQNRLAAYEAGGGALGALGQLGGMALGAYLGGGGTFGFQDGGLAATDGDPGAPDPRDRVPALLDPEEYVVPKEVVRAKGTEFFDKLKERYTGQPVKERRGALG